MNTDTASSDQIMPSVAGNGDRGIITWLDKRSAPVRIHARRFTAEGFAGGDLALPLARAGEPDAPPEGGVGHPEAALRENGDALVCWIHQLGRNKTRLVAQVLGIEGARTGLFDIDAGAEGAPNDPAVVALPGDRGWYVVWPRAGAAGVFGCRVAPDGTLPGNARRISETADWSTADVDVALLDDGKLVCAWTVMPEKEPISIRARVLDDGGKLRFDEIKFEHTRRGEDWDPSLAPAENNGFAMAWTAGGKSDTVRDVVVRLFDAQGRAKSQVATVCYGANEQDFSDIVRMPDRSFAIAWEDDISYYDQVYVRRFARDGKSMSTMMRLNSTDTRFMPDRVAPRIAVVGGGLAAAFADRHRSLGFDAVLKVTGPRWDDAPPPPKGDKPR